GVRRDVVAVKAQAGFKAQTVARSETNPCDVFICEQLVGEFPGFRDWHGDLETVFASVAGAGGEPARLRLDTLHECQVRKIEASFSERRFSGRTLQCEKYSIERVNDAIEFRCNGAQMSHV